MIIDTFVNQNYPDFAPPRGENQAVLIPKTLSRDMSCCMDSTNER
jgi:hypothetical protein